MLNILKKQNGMNIIGQGGKIIFFMLPSLIAAVLVHSYLPQIAALPAFIIFIKPIGYLLLLVGIILWATAVVQLMTGFFKGKLITSGAYGVVRNPIYSSVTFFVLPAVALMTLTWVYFAPSVFLYLGVMIFIGKEEEQLNKAFGKEYQDYSANVDRLVPFAGTRQKEREMERKLLLICGIFASMLYIGTDILACTLYAGYSFTSQAVSELFAIGAPTSQLVVQLFTLSSVLLLPFALGVLLSADRNRALRVMAFMFAGNALNSLVLWNFFPMHMRGVEKTFTDTMHVILAINPFILLALVFGAAAFRNWFRFYSIVTILILLVPAIFAFSNVSQFGANQPTPWMGLTERISQYGNQLWQVVLAVILLRTENKSEK